jgi:probable HAF family extracellular repeat protein
MKTRTRILSTSAAIALAVLSTASPLAAQERPARHSRYTLKILDTLGGPHSQVNFYSTVMNPRGTVVGAASTSVPDPICGFDAPYCYYMHAIKWRDGVLTDLGTLGGGNNSFSIAINGSGSVAGISENGLIDGVFGPAFVATLWKDGGAVELGTFGGSFSLPNDINDRGQLAGGAENTIPDPDDLGGALIGLPSPTLWHAALWQNGSIQDLGTLGDGPASFALFVNERGQVAGVSYTNSIPNEETGIPTVDPFLWENGRMTDLGTLGGAFGMVGGLNKRGQVTGESNVTMDGSINHAFLWDRGSLHDLGTLGGSYSYRAARWKNGHVTNLGSLNDDICSYAVNSNSRGQVVGISISDCDNDARAFLWENGAIVDLNSLIPPGSGLLLKEAAFINEAGEIAGNGVLENGDGRAFVLIPAGRNGDDSVAGALELTRADAAPATQRPATVTHGRLSPQMLAAMRARLARSPADHGRKAPK